MIYLEQFAVPSLTAEENYLKFATGTLREYYPFGVFEEPPPPLEFKEVTIFYGGNGCGKTTLLNVITQKLRLARSWLFNRTPHFGAYLDQCYYRLAGEDAGHALNIPTESSFISSDDVFVQIMRRREGNADLETRHDLASAQYRRARRNMKLNTYEQDGVEPFLEHMESRRNSIRTFVNRRVEAFEPEFSNGESAFRHFTQAIGERGLYLLDEPENSLAPSLQNKLVEFLEASVTCGDQFIIATHSPLLLGLKGAKVYDLDAVPACVRPWQQLENVRLLQEFFERHRREFQSPED